MNNNKHVWEGWTVQSFIDELEPTFNMIMNNGSWQKPLFIIILNVGSSSSIND